MLACNASVPELCGPVSPDPGEVFAGQITCEDQIPWGSEGLVGDLLLANHQGYAVVRVDPDARYFLHVGGGGVLDFTAWGENDPIAEVIPLIGGAWIRGGDLSWGVDGGGAWAQVSGSAKPVPFLDGVATSSTQIRTTLNAEGLRLSFEGNDGLLFLGAAGGTLSEDGVWLYERSGFDLSPVVTDLGGAFVSGSNQIEWTPIPQNEAEDEALEPSEPWRPDGLVRVEFGTRAFPSRDSRLSAQAAQEEAAAEGTALLVLGALDEVATAVAMAEPLLRVTGASEARAPGMGRVLSWPFSPKNHRPAHGAVPWEGLSATEILAVAKGGAARLAMVDLSWVLAAGPVEQWDPLPDFLWLDGLDDFHHFRQIWQEGLRVGFLGEVTWVPADAEELPSVAAIQRPLIQMQSIAGNGPALTMEREPTGDPAWDEVLVSVQIESAGEVQFLRFWTSNYFLGERAVLEGKTAETAMVLVPSHRDVWVSAEGEKWALGSVLPRTRIALPDLQGDFVRDPNTIFHGDTP